jgi:L-ascorbate 6-phosphate lactonase
MTSLMEEIRATRVARKSFALWFLGQNGWILKSPSGFVMAIDPYLGDSCKGRRPYLDQARQVPVMIEAARLGVDLFACTHSHIDHAEPFTIKGALAAGTERYLGPAEAIGVYAQSGVPEEARILTWPNDVKEFADIRITGTFALPTDHTDLTHMGFVIEVDGGPSLYVTGDTAATDILHTAARHKPDVMAVCINAGFKNLSHWQAAEFVRVVDPRVAIPCHYDMFRDNSCSPHMFRASLAIQGIGDKYHEMAYRKPLVYARD